jgi:hypothetical protein
LRLEIFFHADRINQPGPGLHSLNAALQYRSVSVPSDEPLCIACLMSLPLAALLGSDVNKDDRMPMLWKLIAEKEGGIPSSIIFFEDTGLNARGWRWAPASLLTTKIQWQTPDTRILTWKDGNRGEPTVKRLESEI